MTDEEYQVLKTKVVKLTGIDLDSYKSQQMRRRLAFFVEKINGLDTAAYCQKIEADKDCVVKLRDYLTINVTEFFRDCWAFGELEKNILPALIRKKKTLRIWSAGCSNGGEPYSLAILLKAIAGSAQHEIVATDVDELCLAKAGAGGPYNADSVKGVPASHMQQYFTSSSDGLRVKPEIRNMVRFQRHNILSEPFEQGFDLVCCRNVTIYFTDEAKNKLNQQIHNSLNYGGVLFIGATEFIHNAAAIGFNKLSNCFYQKVALPVSINRLPEEPILQTVRR
jgi:chemotaxis protein methyltransferase CheR